MKRGGKKKKSKIQSSERAGIEQKSPLEIEASQRMLSDTQDCSPP